MTGITVLYVFPWTAVSIINPIFAQDVEMAVWSGRNEKYGQRDVLFSEDAETAFNCYKALWCKGPGCVKRWAPIVRARLVGVKLS